MQIFLAIGFRYSLCFSGHWIKVEHLISGMLHAKLVTYLKNQDLHGFRLVLNLEHIYLRRSHPGQWSSDDLEHRGPALEDFMKENGFKRPAPNCWDPKADEFFRGRRMSKVHLKWLPLCTGCLRSVKGADHFFRFLSWLIHKAQWPGLETHQRCPFGLFKASPDPDLVEHCSGPCTSVNLAGALRVSQLCGVTSRSWKRCLRAAWMWMSK